MTARGSRRAALYAARSEGRDQAAGHRPSGRVPFTRGRAGDHVPGPASGPCASTRASPPPKNPTSATSICSRQGQTGLSVAFDLPTQIGYDSDHPLAAGEVGKVGVAIDSLADMETLFDGIPLDKVSTSMTINAPAAVLLAMYMAVAEKQGVRRGQARAAPSRTTSSRSTWPAAPTSTRPALHAAHHRHLRLLRDKCPTGTPSPSPATTSARRAPRRPRRWPSPWPTASPTSRRPSRRASRWTTSRRGSSFFFNAHNDLFEEVAKFRAARRLWARIMRERFGAKDPKS